MAKRPLGLYARWLAFLLVGALLLGSLAYAASFPTSSSSNGPSFPSPIRHVVTIVMENNNVNTTRAQGAYFASLSDSYGFLPHYYAACHPSAPNYLAMTTGEPLQCGSDGVSKYSVRNVVDLLNAAGETWKGYFESMPTPCDASDANLYVAHHNPFVYFSDISSATCRSQDVGFGSLWNDVNSTNFPNYAWITPNMHDDCHSAPISYCDAWLSHFLPELMSKPWAASTVFLITFDEGLVNGVHQYTGYNGLTGGNVYFAAVCANYCPHRVLPALESHYNYLTTVEWLLALGSLGRNDNPTLYAPLTGLFSFGSTGTGSFRAPSVAAAPTSVAVGASATLSVTSGFSGGTAPYRCQWLVQAPSASASSPLGSSFACSPSSNAPVSTGALTQAGVYRFALAVTDSSSPAQTVQSSTATVSVGSSDAFQPPLIHAAPAVIDKDRSSTLLVTRAFEGGLGPYTCQWRVWSPGKLQMTFFGPLIAPCSAAEPTSTGPLATAGTWVFDLRVKDSASSDPTVYSNNVTVTVNRDLDVPSVAPVSPVADANAGARLSAVLAGGTGPYACQWLALAPGAVTYVPSGSTVSCGAKSVWASGALPAFGAWLFELRVTDRTGAGAISSPVGVVVNPTLLTPTAAVSTDQITAGRVLSFVSSGASGGTPPYAYQWYVRAPGSSVFVPIEDAAGQGAAFATSEGAAPGAWVFELKVTDAVGVSVVSNSLTVRVEPSAGLPPTGTGGLPQTGMALRFE